MINDGRNIQAALILTAGLLSISFASIFIKLCDAPALVISTYRLGIASFFYLALLKIRKRSVWKLLPALQRKWLVVSGLFLSLHFITWITSLQYASVATSVVLVQTAPIFVALGGALFLGEKPSGLSLLGVLLAIAGCLVISGNDFDGSLASLKGNALALIGAVAAAGYLLIGRRWRAHMDTVHYVAIVYSAAALATLLLNLSAGLPLHAYSLKTFALFFAIAIFPQIIGHTSLNWALKHFSATSVSILTLAEPIGASILAYLILSEPVGWIKGLGGAIILLGVIITLIGEKTPAGRRPFDAS